MRADFSSISILGGGLLGGSLAMKLTQMNRSVRLWARREQTVEAALESGIANATTDLETAVRGSDLVVLAVPVGSMPALVSQALEAGMPDGCLVTDVGSVKRAPHQTIPPLLAGRDVHFIGSHPMAGSEQNGITAASASLFENAACLLTNDQKIGQELAVKLERFWQEVGCRTAWMSASSHDALVARISHLPHIVAASAARICLPNPNDGQYGGGGLRDTTRVASGNPEMWAEIITENRESIAQPLSEIIADLQGVLAILESGDQDAAHHWLAVAKQQRDLLRLLS